MEHMKDWKELMGKLPELEVRFDEELSVYNTFRVGGRASCMVFPSSLKEIQNVLGFVSAHEIPFLVLGRGSNALISDEGFSGMVMSIGNRLGDFRIEGNRVKAQAGTPLPMLANKTADSGLAGLEFAAGIPGSVGGSVRMNAGTGDGDIGGVIGEVISVQVDGQVKRRGRKDLEFGYRKSEFQGNGEVVAEATFILQEEDPEKVRERIKVNLDYRAKTQPLAIPSAGSVFKNPPDDSAGRLLEYSGCKGLRIGAAAVSRTHANWIINEDGASAIEIWRLVSLMRGRVLDRAGVRLEIELELVGEGFEDPL